MTVTGQGQIIRNRTGGGGCIASVDHLHWTAGATPEDFTITVVDGETLVIGAWWLPDRDQGADALRNVDIDGVFAGPAALNYQVANDITWPAHFWEESFLITVDPGDHDINFAIPARPAGSMVVFHVLGTCYGYQERVGG